MRKSIYIFNCKGLTDPLSIVSIYSRVVDIVPLSCNKYSCIFKRYENEFGGRSGSVKNMEKNVTKYLDDPQCPLSSSSFNNFEIYDQPKGTQRWELEKRSCGFYVERLKNKTTNFYLIVSNELATPQILELWECLLKFYSMNYMVSFSLKASKKPEIFMYGHPIYPVDADTKSYYSNDEMLMVKKLYALRFHTTFDLEGVFPMCITTENTLIDKYAYSVRIPINQDAIMFIKQN